MIVHLVRHGETVSSRRVYAGQRNVALNENGRIQAERVAEKLAPLPIDEIFVSPLSRSIDTAQPLAKRLNLRPKVEPALMEIDFGEFEGHAKDHIGLRLRKSHARQPLPGGESLWDVWQRASIVVERVTANTTEKRRHIVIVGHHWINRMIYGRLANLDFESSCMSRVYRPKTGSIKELVICRAL